MRLREDVMHKVTRGALGYRSAMAYRGPAEERRRAPEGGLVEEIVKEFADRFAYARELVQNSIDAGATAITVRVQASRRSCASGGRHR